jgi:uncharacterized tellurite resistance protein B-like protein
MLFKWLMGGEASRTPAASEELIALVARAMPQAGAREAAIVGALAGLMACVAHADRKYSEAEREAVSSAFGKIGAIASDALGAIEELFSERLAELAHEPMQTYTRVLYENLERPARLEVLDALMDLAAADEVLDMQETNLLRRIARGLGLSDQEYVASQQQHRARLSVLRG